MEVLSDRFHFSGRIGIPLVILRKWFNLTLSFMIFLGFAVPIDWFSDLPVLPLLVLVLSCVLAVPIVLFKRLDGIRFLPYFYWICSE
jgi:hypothetical protein